MGLHIHSLVEIPADASRNYYIYLLDYGWKESLSEALFENFNKMAELASKNDAVVIRGIGDAHHFEDEVFSWHNLNGEETDEYLPGILVTNRNPHHFRKHFPAEDRHATNNDFKIIVFPLKKHCKTTSDVVTNIEKIFKDILEKKDLSDFKVLKEMKKGLGRSIVDGLILEPNIGGIGFNFSVFMDYFRKK